jgi:hypothetical protein
MSPQHASKRWELVEQGNESTEPRHYIGLRILVAAEKPQFYLGQNFTSEAGVTAEEVEAVSA